MKTRKRKMIVLVILAGFVVAVILWGLTPVRTTEADCAWVSTSPRSEQCIRPYYQPRWLALFAAGDGR